MAIFKGAGVAIITPMKENLEVNYDKLDEILEEQIAGETDSIIICGTTGESATLSEQEHMDVIKFAIERVNHRIPVQEPVQTVPLRQCSSPKRRQR